MYILYLAMLILRAYTELRSMPFFGKYNENKNLYEFILCLLISFFNNRYAFEIFNSPDAVCYLDNHNGDNMPLWFWHIGRQFCGFFEYHLSQFSTVYVLLWSIKFLFVYHGLCLRTQWTFFSGYLKHIFCFVCFIQNFNLFLAEISVTKDNPAFSMINDSDEEVVYGSEDESRRPLTVAGKNDYDSD